ncbi:hypothetical protein [Mariniluteicoccus flavus]
MPETNDATTDRQPPVEEVRDAAKKVPDAGKGVRNPHTPDDGVRQTYPIAKGVGTPDTPDDLGVNPENPETFPRDYVEKLRKEAADHRAKAKDRDDLARELFHSRVSALGRLADPDDLPYDEKLLSDLPALEAAVDDLLSRKPHLASRTPRGDIGQGASAPSENVDLAALLRAGAN